MDATIKNLHVTSNAAIGYRGSGSIVTYSKGAVKLINCRSSVKVDCQGSEYYGGLVGTMSTAQFDVASPNPNSVTIEGCVFDGSINSSYTNEYRAHDCSGFVGDAGEGGTVIIRNSILKPGSVGTGILSNTFARMNGGTLTIENSYFVAADNLPTDQGTQAHTISGGEGVTLSGLGTATDIYFAIGQDPDTHKAGLKLDYTHNAQKMVNVTATLNNTNGKTDLSKMTSTNSLADVFTAIMAGNSIEDMTLTLLGCLTTNVKVSDCEKVVELQNQMAEARRNYADQKTIENYVSQLNKLVTCSMSDKSLSQEIPMKLVTTQIGIDYWAVPALKFADETDYVPLTEVLDQKSVEYGMNIVDHAIDPAKDAIIVARQLMQAVQKLQTLFYQTKPKDRAANVRVK